MPAATPKPVPPEPLRFSLAVSPETEHTRWRATLVARGSRVREEFHSPLELLRRIAALSLGERQGGLR
jgi:hypothetical protein